MNTRELKAVKAEMRRLKLRIGELERKAKPDISGHYWAPRETGAVRRASMDLSRTLADLRR